MMKLYRRETRVFATAHVITHHDLKGLFFCIQAYYGDTLKHSATPARWTEACSSDFQDIEHNTYNQSILIRIMPYNVHTRSILFETIPSRPFFRCFNHSTQHRCPRFQQRKSALLTPCYMWKLICSSFFSSSLWRDLWCPILSLSSFLPTIS